MARNSLEFTLHLVLIRPHNSSYFFNISKQKKVNNFFRVSVGEGVWDMVYKNKKLYLFLNNANSVGVINLTEFEISVDFK